MIKKKKSSLAALIVGVMLIMAVACDDGGSGGGGGPYTLHGGGLTYVEWDFYSSMFGGVSNPSELINKDLSSAEVNSIFAMLAADDDGLHLFGQTESQLRQQGENRGFGSAVINTMLSKLNQQGWVLYATLNTASPSDYVDVIGIRRY